MRYSFQVVLLCSVALSGAVAANAIPDNVLSVCQSPTIVSETFIGEHEDVKVQAFQCANTLTREVDQGMARRTHPHPPVNICGATCDMFCFQPAGGGPDPNECHVISDALRYNSQNIGPLFTIPASASVIGMQYRSSWSFFVNQAEFDLAYCRLDWAAVLDWVAFNCQAPQNAHGGLCIAPTSQWFIQVQHTES
ncbi:hypothetical protein BXZ70DRAFT_1005562 [Cristinia sonorae]|uniref:Uncharacterized protein n=1 Tax=Cristinia sonorae TaxID=1940300 RepID=A0A8K0UUR8_9AGAR|nr:hypothetical protein BXZ70DRAFT_1005562 [Cristinia sonorae]